MTEKLSPGAMVAPAAARNRDPILAVLRDVLPARGVVLEIASGSGEHAVHFAQALPEIIWQPSDADAAALASIRAYRDAYGASNLLPPLRIDARDPPWPVDKIDAVLSINMIHIAPWNACEGLFLGASQVLRKGGKLILYGPFNIDGRFTAQSNEAFDASLKARDASWGIRDLADVEACAARNGLRLVSKVEMPANNLTVVFTRKPGD
jgi:cyclopropane fatty-acyl-phospholipid synthase-like methyltransferase